MHFNLVFVFIAESKFLCGVGTMPILSIAMFQNNKICSQPYLFKRRIHNLQFKSFDKQGLALSRCIFCIRLKSEKEKCKLGGHGAHF